MLFLESPKFSMLGSSLSSRMDTYCSASIHPSISTNIPTPFWPMHFQTIKKPSPSFTIHCSIKACLLFFHTYILPFDLILLIFVSSDHITLVQSSIVQFLYLRAKSTLLFPCLLDNRGFLLLTIALKIQPCEHCEQFGQR